MALSESAVVSPAAVKAGRAASREGTAKQMTSHDKKSGEPLARSQEEDAQYFSGEERRLAVDAISESSWRKIASSRYVAISIDERTILRHGSDSLALAESAAESGHRYTVVTNPFYTDPEARGPKKSVA